MKKKKKTEKRMKYKTKERKFLKEIQINNEKI